MSVPTLRLDRREHCQALTATVARLRPALLVLDPFVRLHAIDENVAGEVAPLLGFLRSLQRDHRTAVALVHHARKGAAHERGGQALRGSSELHAWGDSNLYLRRLGQNLYLSVEHRAAPGIDRLQLTLKVNPPELALALVEKWPVKPCLQDPSPCERIEQILTGASTPLTQRQLRDAARMRASHVGDALSHLVATGRVIQSAEGYRINSA
jgi:AAA domain